MCGEEYAKFQFSTSPVALGLVSVDRAHQLHTGIYYVDSNAKGKFLHLLNHFKLRNYDVPSEQFESYSFADINVIEEEYRIVTSYCRLIWEKNRIPGIPYGFANGLRFGREGVLQIKGTSGLTCASFVLSILESAGLSWIDPSGWRDPAEDEEWMELVIESVKSCDPGDDYILLMKADKSCFRFRPNEVFAVCCMPDRPVSFSRISESAERIRIRANEAVNTTD